MQNGSLRGPREDILPNAIIQVNTYMYIITFQNTQRETHLCTEKQNIKAVIRVKETFRLVEEFSWNF